MNTYLADKNFDCMEFILNFFLNNSNFETTDQKLNLIKFQLTQISIPSSVIKITLNAFRKCLLLAQVRFYIPSFATSIEESAFSRCSTLKQILKFFSF